MKHLLIIFLITFSKFIYSTEYYYQLFVISLTKESYLDENENIKEKLVGISQFETSRWGGGKFSTEEECHNYLKDIAKKNPKNFKIEQNKFNYALVLIEEDIAYYTERRCILID